MALARKTWAGQQNQCRPKRAKREGNSKHDVGAETSDWVGTERMGPSDSRLSNTGRVIILTSNILVLLGIYTSKSHLATL
jgi:hypothetical protein